MVAASFAQLACLCTALLQLTKHPGHRQSLRLVGTQHFDDILAVIGLAVNYR